MLRIYSGLFLIFVAIFAISVSYAEESPYALIGAAHRGDVAKIKALLDQGFDVNKKGHDYGKTALMYATEIGHDEIVKMLLDKGANANITDNKGQTALMLVAKEFAWAKDKDIKYVHIIRLLLDKGANVNAQDNDGKTALIHMVIALNPFSPNEQVRVKTLLASGADVSIKDKKGETALTYAMKENLVDVLKIFRDSGIKPYYSGNINLDFFNAVKMNDLNIIKTLVDKGVDINIKDENKDTALTLSVRAGQLDIVKFLIEKGVDINAKLDKETRVFACFTPLMFAAQNGHVEIAKLLIDKGADINARDCIGGNALMDAARSGHLEIAKLLLNKGADVNAKSNNGFTALIDAVWYPGRSPELIRLLISKGADVNARYGESGNTALIRAIDNNDIEAVKILLASGADVTLQNKFLKITVLKKAIIDKRDKEIIQLLKDAGAKE